MDNFRVVYIDDHIDPTLSRYLGKEYDNKNEIVYTEIEFDPSHGYQSLLTNPDVKSANIIFIDSQLFENKSANHSDFTGEEFKLILKKLYPFIEVIVITQNDIDVEITAIKKYDSLKYKNSAKEYYDHVIPKIIMDSYNTIKQYEYLAKKVERNDSWSIILKEKVLGTLKGCDTYDELKTEDIDKIIEAFNKIQEALDGN